MIEQKKKSGIHKSPIRALLVPPVAFHPVLARICGSITAGLMLSQAIYWSERTDDQDGWFWKSQEEWTEEICLSRYEQEGARAQLQGLGFIEVKRGMAKLYFRIRFDKIEEAIRHNAEIPQYVMRKSRILKCGNSTMRKSRNSKCGKTAIRNAEKQQFEMRKSRNASLFNYLITAETTSSSELQAITQELSRFCTCDDDASRTLLDSCRKQCPDATLEELLHFIREKGELSRCSSVRNPLGMLLTAVPKCFQRNAIDAYRKGIRACSLTASRDDMLAARANEGRYHKAPSDENEYEWAKQRILDPNCPQHLKQSYEAVIAQYESAHKAQSNQREEARA